MSYSFVHSVENIQALRINLGLSPCYHLLNVTLNKFLNLFQPQLLLQSNILCSVLRLGDNLYNVLT